VTANMGEEGIFELCELLLGRGIGIEAGLLSLADARVFVKSGIAPRCVRAMVEPLDLNPSDALAHAEVIALAPSRFPPGLLVKNLPPAWRGSSNR